MLDALATGVRPSAKIGRVAQLLDMDPSQVRRLVDTVQLQAHRIGKRGIRVFLDSVACYQERNSIVPAAARAPIERARVRRLSAEHHKAVARLKELGLLEK